MAFATRCYSSCVTSGTKLVPQMTGEDESILPICEPNDFKHRLNWTFAGDQLGRDVLLLQKILSNDPRFQKFFANSTQVGPDVNRPPRSLTFLVKYLSVVHNSLDAITLHQYYMNGRTATISDFINPDILDYLPTQIAQVTAVIREAGLPHAKLWLGETSTAWGGGAEGMSDAYVAGFMWLDKLGISAKMGISLVVRQTFYGGHYSLIDRYLRPLPDYWLSLLFKRLVGSRVLNVKLSVKDGHTVRVYAHCTVSSGLNYSEGAVTVYALNLRNSAAALVLPTELRHLTKHQYLLTPSGPDGLKSRCVNLNGRKLEMIDDRTLPPLAPKQLTPDEVPTLPPLTFAFFVIPDAKASACL
ncbi:hypothetical protein LSAT2_014658 [Lamellibrachia satsuma]|nr:hypothetical protein LSAT2_014658 [Lamellibrachia satsuma]